MQQLQLHSIAGLGLPLCQRLDEAYMHRMLTAICASSISAASAAECTPAEPGRWAGNKACTAEAAAILRSSTKPGACLFLAEAGSPREAACAAGGRGPTPSGVVMAGIW